MRYLLALKEEEYRTILAALKDHRFLNQESMNREDQHKIQILEQRMNAAEGLTDSQLFAYDVSSGRWLMQRKPKSRRVGQILKELNFIRRADPVANLVCWLIEDGTTEEQLKFALRESNGMPIAVELQDKFQAISKHLPTTNKYGVMRKWH